MGGSLSWHHHAYVPTQHGVHLHFCTRTEIFLARLEILPRMGSLTGWNAVKELSGCPQFLLALHHHHKYTVSGSYMFDFLVPGLQKFKHVLVCGMSDQHTSYKFLLLPRALRPLPRVIYQKSSSPHPNSRRGHSFFSCFFFWLQTVFYPVWEPE